MWRSLRRAGLGVGVLLLMGATAGATFEVVAASRDAAAYPPPGRLVDVGSHQMHIACVGEGSPTVVFESGLANMSADWANIQPSVGAYTRACAYDRTGIAWSNDGPHAREPRQIAQELHTLLTNAGVPGPYVLAGQSFGGLYVRVFADLYPDEVAGLVFVDASHPDQWQRVPPEVAAAFVPTPTQALAFRGLAHLGFTRLTGAYPAQCGLAAAQCAEERAWMMSARKMDAFVAEMGAPQRDAQVRASATLGARPLVVLTASEHSDMVSPAYASQFDALWRQLQADLATLSTNSTHSIVDGSTHGSLQTQHAAVTSAAVQQVVQSVRTGQPLATLEGWSPTAATQ